MKLYPIFIRPMGGAVNGRVPTQCFLITEKKQIVAYGEAFKRPEDNFDRKKGMRIALGRAVKAFQIGYWKETRWSDFPKASRLHDFYDATNSLGGYFMLPPSHIPIDTIQKVDLAKKECIEVMSDEEVELNTKPLTKQD